MRAILLAAAIFFIITGIIIAALPFMLPVALAFGLTTAQGLGLALGGFLLLALTRLIHAVEQATDAWRKHHDAAPDALPDAPPDARPSASSGAAPTHAGQGMALHARHGDAAAPPGKTQAVATGNAPAAPAPDTAPQSAEPLHVVRQCTMRGRPARILSDGSIEAELDEGWLRFESEQHLNEYLDALEDMRRKGLL